MIEKRRQISLCALLPYPVDTTPSQRFRIEQWEPFLKEAGISVDYYSFTDERLSSVLHKPGHIGSKIRFLGEAVLRRLSHVNAARKYDAAFVHRGLSIVGPAFLERFLKLLKVPMIFDFDDSIFLPDTSNENKLFGWAKFAGKIETICRISDSVTVGNSYLKEYAERFNDRVYTVPTSIDVDKYQPAAKREGANGRIVVGWTGSSTSQYHLEMFEPVLADLLKERDVEIRVVSNREPSFKQVPYVWRAWSPETEVEEISQIDIGIMPTPDDEWSRGKCALKALQYMSLGIPAICTDMGANRDVVRNGENGFLAKTPEDWLRSFKTLIDDPELRARYGANARRTVVENYSMRRCAELFADVVRQTARAE